jgi:hypothetical protein
MEIGVRPSFENLAVVEEKVRRVWRAGTRKLGRVATEEVDETVLSSARLLLGANILAVLNECGRRWDSGRSVMALSSKNVSIGCIGQSVAAGIGPCVTARPR